MTDNTPNAFDALLANADTFDGVDIADKATLIGKAFIITKVWYETGARNVEYVYADITLRDGTTTTINDSSNTGIKAQISEYLAKTGQNPTRDNAAEINLYIPGGLRKSEYDVTDSNGRKKTARTYYLTRGTNT